MGSTRPDHAAALILAALPLVVLVVLRVSPYFRLNNGDPFIYIGYANDLRGHVARFGYTYHAVRFGLIFPMRLSLMFGPVWGYFLLRYVLYLVAIIPMFLALKPFGRRIALLGPVLFIANPVSAEAILTTHPDTITVPCLAAVMSSMVLIHRRSGRSAMLISLLTGVIAGVALNANVFFAPLLALSMLVLCIVLWVGGRRLEMLGVGVAYTAGVAAVCLLGMATYKYLFDDANIFETTLNEARDVNNSAIWKTPGYSWMETRRYMYAPVFALLLGVVSFWRQRTMDSQRQSERRILFGVFTALLLFYFVHEFVLGGNSIETSYYYSYIIGPACIVVAAATGWLRSTSKVPLWVLLAFPVCVAYVSQTFELQQFVTYAAVSLVLCLAIVWSRTAAASAAVIVAMNVAWGASPREIAPIPGAGFQYEPHYENAFGSGDKTAYDVYRVASELPAVVPASATSPVPLRFWYKSFDPMLDSVEGTYHWELLTIQHQPAPGMPDLQPDDIAELRTLVGGYVILLARSSDEIEAGLASLRAAGFVLGDVPPMHTLTHGDSTVKVLSVTITSGPAETTS